MEYESSLGQSNQDFSLDLRNFPFSRMQHDMYVILEVVRKHHGASFFEKLFSSIFGKKDTPHNPRLMAQSLVDACDTKTTQELSAQLSEDPALCQVRSNLVKHALDQKRLYETPVYREMLFQACLSIYIGGANPRNMQTVGQVYINYLRHIADTMKKNLLSVRSSALQNINVSKISMDDLNKGLEEMEPEDAMALHELNFALHTLERNKELMAQMLTSITIPVDLAELNKLSPSQNIHSGFVGEGGSGTGAEKETVVIRKVTAVADVMRFIPPLHSLALNIAKRLQTIESAIPQHYLLEARVRTEAFRTLLLRVELRHPHVRAHMLPAYKKMLDAYYKAYKRASKTTPDMKEFPIFSEFAQAAYLSHLHRKSLGLEPPQVGQILKDAKEAVDLAVTLEANPNQRKMQARITEQLPNYGVIL